MSYLFIFQIREIIMFWIKMCQKWLKTMLLWCHIWGYQSHVWWIFKIHLQMKMKALCSFKRDSGSYWPVRHRITLLQPWIFNSAVILTLQELVKDLPYSALKCQVPSVDFLTTFNEQIQINGYLQNPHTPYTIMALE